MSEMRRKYDREFREGAVTIVRETARPIVEVARDLGIGAGTLGNWVKTDRLARGEDSERTRVDPAYVRQLERELAELRMERDVLKRSVVLWVKEAAMSVASFVAAQRTDHGVPHVIACRALGVSPSWFYKWRDRPPTPRQARRVSLDAAVRHSFDTSGGRYGSPRVLADLVEAGWRVSKKTVAASMARQGLIARPTRRRRRCLTRPDKTAPPIPDLVKRDFTAPAVNTKWCGYLTEVPTGEGKLYLATVEDLASRRIIGFGLSEHHDAELATAAIKMAVTVRGGDVAGAIFHTDRGSEYSAELFAAACSRSGITQSMGRAESCFDNAAAESFFSTVEWELFRLTLLATKQAARREVAGFIDWYNRIRRHSSCEMKPPIAYEAILATRTAEAGDDQAA